MAWNDKGDQGPWGSKKPGSSQGNNSPDLDELLRQGQENIRRMMGGGSGGRGNRPSFNPRFLALIAFIGIGLWAATGLYRVKEGEQAVVLRFGKVNRTAEAGLRYHIPAPVESARVVPISTINVVNSGTADIVRSKQAFALRGSNVEDLMLTGDEN
ncbi:MAG: protease modulator HflK, partial [Alphaproteobacteria bacterium]|nr:protease modulator HflK [Alphaproteobacteria bacterium]